MANRQPVIRAVSLSKRYISGRMVIDAVRGVDLTVYPGELVYIVGPSGSGKTTLLSMLGCILQPTAGELYIDGQKVEPWDERRLPYLRRRYIGFIFQQFNLFRALTALENVMVALALRGIRGTAARRQALVLLTEIGLRERAHFYPKDLSGGEQQRVAIARALAGDPKILLADEPTGNLDSATGRRIMEYVARLTRERQMATVVVTHDHRILDLGNRIFRMEDGCLQETDRVSLPLSVSASDPSSSLPGMDYTA